MAGTDMTDAVVDGPHAITSRLARALLEELEAGLGMCRSTGLNEAGFKGMVVMALRHVAVRDGLRLAVTSERAIGRGFADLHVVVDARELRVVLVIELKYFRASFWRGAPAASWDTRSHTKRDALTAIAVAWTALAEGTLAEQSFRDPVDGFVRIRDAIDVKHRVQLREYLRSRARELAPVAEPRHAAERRGSATSDTEAVHVHGMLLIGAVNRVLAEAYELTLDGGVEHFALLPVAATATAARAAVHASTPANAPRPSVAEEPEATAQPPARRAVNRTTHAALATDAQQP